MYPIVNFLSFQKFGLIFRSDEKPANADVFPALTAWFRRKNIYIFAGTRESPKIRLRSQAI